MGSKGRKSFRLMGWLFDRHDVMSLARRRLRGPVRLGLGLTAVGREREGQRESELSAGWGESFHQSTISDAYISSVRAFISTSKCFQSRQDVRS